MKKGSRKRAFACDFPVKGCHAYYDGQYTDMAFYGTGGTEEEMKKDFKLPEHENMTRPNGYDCNFIGKFLKYEDVYKKIVNF